MEHLKRNGDKYIKAIFIVLGLTLIVLFLMLIQQYSDLRRAKLLNDQYFWYSLGHRTVPLTPAAADLIQPWMTFDYVNRVFGLPAAYLQTDLKIMSPRYPQVPLYRYAESQQMDVTTFTNEVKAAVRDYSPGVK